jgi:hypothetical protein
VLLGVSNVMFSNPHIALLKMKNVVFTGFKRMCACSVKTYHRRSNMTSKRGCFHRFCSFSNNTLLAHYRSIVFHVETGGTGGTPFVSISFQRVATQTKKTALGAVLILAMTHQQGQFDSI